MSGLCSEIYQHNMLGALFHGIIASSDQPPVSSGTWKVGYGTYLGTAGVLPVTGLGFRPQFIIIKASGSAASDDPVIAWSGMSTTAPATPAAAVISPSTAPATGILTSYDSDGFTLANNALVNSLAVTYYYCAIAGSGAELAVGNYTGNGTDDRDIGGLSFQPSAVFIRRRNLNTPFVTMKLDSMAGDTSYMLGNAAGTVANAIQQFNSDGFQIGTNGNVNTNTASFDWVAFKPATGYGTMTSYVGNGIDNSDMVTGLTFQPTVILVKGNNTQEAVMRTAANTGDDSSILSNSTANGANRIQAINSDGFQVGTNAGVNTAAVTYHVMVLKST